MRFFATFIVTLLLLGSIRRQRTKEAVRRIAIRMCRGLLHLASRPHAMRDGVTLVFAPHPDDETLGCGAYIARRRNEGLPVHIVFITDGSASHPGHPRLSAAEIAAIRRQEAREALAILGVESVAIHFLDEPDGTLEHIDAQRREQLVARIAALLREIRPDEVFLPCSPDGSTEHDAAFHFVIEAIGRLHVFPSVWQYPVWSWWNPSLLIERLLFTEGRCRVNAADFATIKRNALSQYRSQIYPLPPQTEAALPRELIRIFNADVEYFFRFRLSVEGPATAAGKAESVI